MVETGATLEGAVPAAEHDRRVAELLAANNDLLARARRAEATLQRRRENDARHSPPATHRHYFGADVHLISALWRHGCGTLMFRYAEVGDGDGRQWVRTASEFLSGLDRDWSRRRYEPIGAALSSVAIDGMLFPRAVSLHEYRLIADAEMIERGAPPDLVAHGRYCTDWEPNWRTNVSPNEAARRALEALRRAA